MNHILFTSALAVMFILPAGCGRLPEPAAYNYSIQQKMQASHHWDILAADLANQINNALIFGDHINTPVFVRQTCGDDDSPCPPAETSVFAEAFRDLLITNLVSLGVPTNAEPTQETIVVHYKAQPVYHHADRLRTIQPGLLSSLSAGVIVLRNAPWELASLAVSGGLDALNAAYNSLDHFEVLITTSMVSHGKYLYRNSSIYYINTEDSWHYNTAGQPTTIRLTAGHTPVPTAGMQDDPTIPPAPPPADIEPTDSTGI